MRSYTKAEEQFLKDCVLPQWSDNEGRKKIADMFNAKFPADRVRSPLAIYTKAARLQNRWGKAKRIHRQKTNKVKTEAPPQTSATQPAERPFLVRIEGRIVWEGQTLPKVEVFQRV